MLGSIRKFSNSFLAKIVIGLIALAFVFGFGMGDMFKGKQNILVEINDEKITTQEFIAFVQKINLSSKEIERVGKDRIFDEILANYISEKIIAKEAKQKGILLNDKSILKILTNSQEFLKDGKFSKTKYEKFMITSGLTKPQYEKNIQDIESKGQLLNFYSGGIRLPDFVIKDLYVKENTLKKITFLDLNKVFLGKQISQKEIEEFYKKNQNFFKDKFKKLRFAELSPLNVIGKNEFDEEFFKKIDQIENEIIDGKDFGFIISDIKDKIVTLNFINSRKILENENIPTKIDTKLFEEIFNIKNKNEPVLINIDDKYFIAEMQDEKDIFLTLQDKDLVKTIKEQMRITSQLKENVKLTDMVKEGKFKNSEMTKLSMENNVPLETVEIKNIKDTTKFSQKIIDEIYKFSQGQYFIVTDNFLKDNYIVKIDSEKQKQIDLKSIEFKEYLLKANTIYSRNIYKSYDKYINTKYQIVTNQKVFDRLKKSFN
tara:strand:+ start:6408 stop:7865 length:1458 start_codon:yes stop_codon:yes gene_type:complete